MNKKEKLLEEIIYIANNGSMPPAERIYIINKKTEKFITEKFIKTPMDDTPDKMDRHYEDEKPVSKNYSDINVLSGVEGENNIIRKR